VEPHITYTIASATPTARRDGGRVVDICSDVEGVVAGNGGVADAWGCEGMTPSRYGERGPVPPAVQTEPCFE